MELVWATAMRLKLQVSSLTAVFSSSGIWIIPSELKRSYVNLFRSGLFIIFLVASPHSSSFSWIFGRFVFIFSIEISKSIPALSPHYFATFDRFDLHIALHHCDDILCWILFCFPAIFDQSSCMIFSRILLISSYQQWVHNIFKFLFQIETFKCTWLLWPFCFCSVFPLQLFLTVAALVQYSAL